MLTNSPARQGGNFSARHIGRRTEGGEERKEGGRAEGGKESRRREGEREEEGRERKGGRLGERKLESESESQGRAKLKKLRKFWTEASSFKVEAASPRFSLRQP
jgi:hypothetical protein